MYTTTIFGYFGTTRYERAGRTHHGWFCKNDSKHLAAPALLRRPSIVRLFFIRNRQRPPRPRPGRLRTLFFVSQPKVNVVGCRQTVATAGRMLRITVSDRGEASNRGSCARCRRWPRLLTLSVFLRREPTHSGGSECLVVSLLSIRFTGFMSRH